jgi:hypothetical protein
MIDRLRSAFRALFARKPTITVEVTGGTWSAKWKHMTPDEAARQMHDIAYAVEDRAFAGIPCSQTVH